MRWSLLAQLRLGFGMALLLVLGVAAAIWSIALDYRAHIDDAYRTHLRTAEQLRQAESALWQLRYGIPQFIIGRPGDRQRILGEQDQWYALVEERLAAYGRTVHDAEGRRALTHLRAAYQRYKQARPKFFELWQAGEEDEAFTWRALTMTPFGAETVRAIDAQIALQRSVSERERVRVEEDVRAALALVTAITLALLAMLASGYWRGARMLRPLRALRDEALALVRERLGEEVPGRAAGNEIATLESSVRLMTDRLLAHAEALRQSRERLDFLLQTTPAMIWSSTMDGVATYVSPNVRTQLGYEPEEFLRDSNFWSSHIHPEDREAVLAGFAAIKHKDVHAYEYRFRHQDGSWRWVHDELNVMRDASGAPSELVGCWLDITKRKRAEEALRESEAKLGQLLDASPAVIYSTKAPPEYGTLYISGNVRGQLGYEPAEFTADPGFWAAHLHPEDAPRLFASLAAQVEQGHVRNEYRFRHRDGSWRWLHDEATVLRDASGRPQRLIGYGIDITERKTLGDALQASEARLRHLLSASPAVIYSTRTHGDYGATFISANVREQLGHAPEDFLKDSGFWANNIHPDDRERVIAHQALLFSEGRITAEYRFRHQDGSWRWMRDETNLVRDEAGEPKELVGSWIDITERKQLEDALQESEARHRAVIESALDAIVVNDELGRITDLNPAAERIFGYRREEALDRDLAELFIPASDGGIMRGQFRASLARGVAEFGDRRTEVPALHADGHEFPIELTVRRIDRGGRMFFTAFARDISETRRALAALQESEERFHALVESAPQVIILSDPDGRIEFVNQHVEHILGYRPEELTGRNIDLIVPERLRHGHARMCAGYRAAPTMRAMGTGRDLSARRKDGSEVPVEIGLSPLQIGGRVYVLALLVDITESRRARDAIARASRMKSEFMANVTHELRTPLNAVIGFAELLHDEVPGPLNARQAEFAADILAGGRQLLALVEGILEMSRLDAADAALAREPVDIAAALAERVAAHREAAAARGLTMTLEVAADAGSAQLDPRALRRMLDALIDNAIKFNREGGRVALDARRDGDWLEIAVADTGIGIAGADLAKLFQPLVQLDSGLARAHGGIGLGLALARRLAELHGGTIEVDSEPGQGSTFTLRLPVEEEEKA